MSIHDILGAFSLITFFSLFLIMNISLFRWILNLDEDDR